MGRFDGFDHQAHQSGRGEPGCRRRDHRADGEDLNGPGGGHSPDTRAGGSSGGGDHQPGHAVGEQEAASGRDAIHQRRARGDVSGFGRTEPQVLLDIGQEQAVGQAHQSVRRGDETGTEDHQQICPRERC